MDDINAKYTPGKLVASDVKYINAKVGAIGLKLDFETCEQVSKSSIAAISEPIGQFPHCTKNNEALLDACTSY